ncbi:BTAD domain-containing putative transcriptional regulator [Nonomuraea sp. B1E8]|uniref:AfsR/SARP family transcriptional regulator n=1 Tax=unclassified Nonomuraea TaxID=2593643 RepID=UPI00325D4E15
MHIELHLLGSTELVVNGAPVALTGKQRALLSILLLEAGRMVPAEQIADRLWEGRPPSSARARVRALIAELRRSCGDAGPRLLITRQPGYLLQVDGVTVDTSLFEHQVTEAIRAAELDRYDEVIELCDRALGLWRGEPFADAPGLLALQEAARLDELRLTAFETRNDARLALGRYEETVAELRGRMDGYDLRERPRGQLMRALRATGRIPEALEVFRGYRRRLVDELGVEPTPELQRLHQELLDGAPTPSVGPAPTPDVPRQLPAGIRRFVGRESALSQIDELDARAERLIVVAGPAGVGKSALSLHWAHRAAHRFPDGQLFLGMRGFDTAEPMGPDEALPLLLQALGQSSRTIPVGVDAQAALYRSLLADRRCLLVFDDVSEPAQVRPLLPGGSGCLVLITSRDRLGGLVAFDGARRLTIDVMRRDDALALLQQVGGRQILDEDGAAERLAELCGYLPLALCIAGARIAEQGGRPVRHIVEEFSRRGRLTRLQLAGEPHTAVRAALDLSYLSLQPADRRMFRLLGLVPARRISVAAAAALAGLPLPEAQDLLDSTARVHLVSGGTELDYGVHGLVLDYAAERARAEETADDRANAVRRLLDYSLHSVRAVARAHGLRDTILPDEPPAPGVYPEEFDGAPAAQAWLDTEWDNLVGLLAHVAEHGPRRYAWLIVDALQDLLHHRRSLSEWLRLVGLALGAAEKEQDGQGEAAMLLSTGHVRWRLTDLRGALEAYERALHLARGAGWRLGEAYALVGCGVAVKQLGDPGKAVGLYATAAEIHQELGSAYGQAQCLNNVASAELTLARLPRAEKALQRAIPLAVSAKAKHLEALACSNLGLIRQKQGRLGNARLVLRRAVRCAVEAGSAFAEGMSLEYLGRVHCDAGRYTEAIAVQEQALSIAARVEHQNCQVDALAWRSRAELGLGRTADAAEHVRIAVEIAERTGYAEGLVEALTARAEISCAAERLSHARADAERAVLLAQEKAPVVLARAHGVLAVALLALGEHAASETECDRALLRSGQSGERLVQARVLLTLGRLRAATMGGSAATWLLRRAHGLFAEMGVGAGQESACPLLVAHADSIR